MGQGNQELKFEKQTCAIYSEKIVTQTNNGRTKSYMMSPAKIVKKIINREKLKKKRVYFRIMRMV